MIITIKEGKKYKVRDTTSYQLEIHCAVTTHVAACGGEWTKREVYVPLDQIIEIEDIQCVTN